MTVTLITGANKGLGYETARQLMERGHTVDLGARNAERGQVAASALGGQFVQLDVTDDSSVEGALGAIAERSENPVVVNVSSALGSFWAVTNPERRQFHFPSIIYGSSKAAVSMLTVQYAKTFPGIKFNAVEPGFSATDLTPFSSAGQPVDKGAEVIVRMATIGADGPSGTFQEDDGELAW